MKRSEILMLIAEAQSDCPDMDSAEYILKSIEDAGMLPPKNGKDFFNGCCYEEDLGWEAEDGDD